MTSPLRRKRRITPSNTEATKGPSVWSKLVAGTLLWHGLPTEPRVLLGARLNLIAGAVLALLLSTGAAAAEQRPSVLKIRSAASSAPEPAEQQQASRPVARKSSGTTLKKLAHAPRLSPTPTPPPMFDEEFESSVVQVAYEEYQLISQEQEPETVERATPLLNANTAPPRRSCEIKINRSIHQLTDNTQTTAGRIPEECPAPYSGPFEPRSWDETTFMWKASALCHKPLYFEDVQLERYGHSWGPVVQPVVSGGMFFASIPTLPYKMGVELPWECVYPLGYYRPGDCAPYMIPPVPVSVRGATAQAAAVTGGVLLIP